MDLLGTLEAERALVVVRAPRIEDPEQLAATLTDSGLRLIEVTLTVGGALDAIEAISAAGGDAIVGAGTVRDVGQAQAAIERGARFLVTPGGGQEVAAEARKADVDVIVGALTPSEVLAARSMGAAAVKLFPASLGGPRYVRELRAPLPDIPLVPSGGIDAGNAGAFLDAGAIAVSCGSGVVSEQALANRNWRAISRAARALIGAVRADRRERERERSSPAASADPAG